MIDQQLIDSAKYIRKNFLTLTERLGTYRKDVIKLHDFLKIKVDEIKEWNDTVLKKMRSKSDATNAINHLMKELTSIEDEEKKIKVKVESINVEIEKLRKEEEILYEAIKKRYPDLTYESILKEIHSNLEK
jgi:predicted  nucleic acid-binding Zn-ribbon protein